METQVDSTADEHERTNIGGDFGRKRDDNKENKQEKVKDDEEEREISSGDRNSETGEVPVEISDEVVYDEEAGAEVVLELTPEQKKAKDRFLSSPHRRAQALADQRYHLPGNDWKSDYIQYFSNNHPLFGIFCHDRDHPIGWRMRLLCFFSSIFFGLAITNFVWLWAQKSGQDSTLVTVQTSNVLNNQTTEYTQYIINTDANNNVAVTTDMIVLWTVGDTIHGAFDNLIWTLTICSCCDPGQKYAHLKKYKRFGAGLLAFFIVFIMALCSLTVVIRGIMETDEPVEVKNLRSAGINDDQIDWSKALSKEYAFLLSCSVELLLALFVYYPLVGTVLFSGVLVRCCSGIFRTITAPQLGGRPHEVEEEEKELQEVINNPNLDLTEDDEEELEVWGMRKRNDNGEFEDDRPCHRLCFRLGSKGEDDTDNKAISNTPPESGSTDDDSHPKTNSPGNYVGAKGDSISGGNSTEGDSNSK